MGEGQEKMLADELAERGMKREMASTCQSLMVKVATRARRAAYIEEILGDMATLHHFKTDDYMAYVRFHGQLDSCLKALMMYGYMTFNQNTGEYAVTETGRDRVAKYLPRQR